MYLLTWELRQLAFRVINERHELFLSFWFSVLLHILFTPPLCFTPCHNIHFPLCSTLQWVYVKVTTLSQVWLLRQPATCWTSVLHVCGVLVIGMCRLLNSQSSPNSDSSSLQSQTTVQISDFLSIWNVTLQGPRNFPGAGLPVFVLTEFAGTLFDLYPHKGEIYTSPRCGATAVGDGIFCFSWYPLSWVSEFKVSIFLLLFFHG